MSKTPIESQWLELRQAFDALGPGESLTVVGVKDCGQTLRQLQAHCLAACEQIALSETKLGTRIELKRRVGAATTSIYDRFESDHERLNAILAQLVTSLRAGDISAAREQCQRFGCGVQKHIAAEESVLFPLMQEAYGLAVGDKTVMGTEHRQILELGVSLGAMLQSAASDVCINAVLELSQLLARHNMKEETILYPMVDRWIGAQDSRRELVVGVLTL